MLLFKHPSANPKGVTLIGIHVGQMTERPGLVGANLLAAWVLLLLGCGAAASPDTDLLMQAPFAGSLNWTAAADLCNTKSFYYGFTEATVTCDVDDNITEL